MILVIDAYNVLKPFCGVEKISELMRQKFIKQLSEYAHHKGHKIVLVFDAGPYDRVTREHVKGVTVFYSGVHESADDVIKRYLREHRAQDILLVSADNDVRLTAEHLALESIRGDDFYRVLQAFVKNDAARHANSEGIIKTTQAHDEALDELMLHASKNVQVKTEDFVAHKTRLPKRHKPSKHERLMTKK